MATLSHPSSARLQKRFGALGAHSPKTLSVLALGALGVVFGDIGTSPLYALKECFDPHQGLQPSQANVFGVLSLIFWSLTLVISLKYLLFILKADNKGEGGIMALLGLITARNIAEARAANGATADTVNPLQGKDRKNRFKTGAAIYLGLIGAALLYGDGIITPAISVLSAVEGLQVAIPTFQPFVVPLTVAILFLLFTIQSRGTAHIGSIFGPTILIWFLMIAGVGIPWIIGNPEILLAINPVYAVRFFIENGTHGFFLLSSVVLCITGGEAMYADMGHFGVKPIRLGWFLVAFPALILNYFGQGALMLAKGPEVLSNPFYSLVDGWMRYPLIAIATLATVIASQALISGAFSLTQQAVQLGYLPRLTIHHTSKSTEGQIYVPRVNQLLMIGCIALVLYFQESTKLASAYGIAVTGTMVTTTLLFYLVATSLWKWKAILVVPMTIVFLGTDLAFFSANLSKIAHGGWVPISIGCVALVLMTTWKRGRELLGKSMLEIAQPLDQFFVEVARTKPPRVNGTAVFMTLTRNIAPSVLLHHFRHNQVLHEKVLLMSVITKNEPEIDPLERVRVTELTQGFYKVVACYGYTETPDMSDILGRCESAGITIDHTKLSFYLGRETFLTSGTSRMWHWRKKLFVIMSKNARTATEFFRIPPDRVIEIGSQIRI
jgi:KUP system potassium uptake protein